MRYVAHKNIDLEQKKELYVMYNSFFLWDVFF